MKGNLMNIRVQLKTAIATADALIRRLNAIDGPYCHVTPSDTAVAAVRAIKTAIAQLENLLPDHETPKRKPHRRRPTS